MLHYAFPQWNALASLRVKIPFSLSLLSACMP